MNEDVEARVERDMQMFVDSPLLQEVVSTARHIANTSGYPLRKGQTFSNALAQVDINLASRAITEGFDPFYDDEKIPEFFTWLYRQRGTA